MIVFLMRKHDSTGTFYANHVPYVILEATLTDNEAKAQLKSIAKKEGVPVLGRKYVSDTTTGTGAVTTTIEHPDGEEEVESS